MKNLIWLPSLFLISACGDEDSAARSSTTTSEPAVVAMSAPVDVPSGGQTANLPWNIPTMPNARVIHEASNFSRTTVRRGGESTALIAFKGTPSDIVVFYMEALAELGFDIPNSPRLDEVSTGLKAVHADGRTFQIFANRGGSKTRDGESSAALVATMPKLTE